MKNNGIEIIERKNGFVTKKVRANGFTMRTYHRCPNPKSLKFRSKLVNDKNQDLCGGWFRQNVDHQKETVDRVIKGLKPFGIIGGYNLDKDVLDNYEKQLKKAGFATNRVSRERGHEHCLEQLEFCIKNKTVASVFDLKTLAEDYDKFLITEDIRELKNDVKFEDFFNGHWDVETLPLWLVGLILGYPIENTMSLYLR